MKNKAKAVFLVFLCFFIFVLGCTDSGSDSGSNSTTSSGGGSGDGGNGGGDTPANATNFTATAGNASVTLSWTSPIDENLAGFELIYGTETISIDYGNSSYVVRNLINGTAYTFKLVSIDFFGNKSSGVTANATPIAGGNGGGDTPANATNFTATAGNASVTLSWTSPIDEDLTGFELIYGTETISIDYASSSYVVRNLINGTAYTFKLVSIDLSGNKSSGVTANATPIAGVPDTSIYKEVTGLEVTETKSTSVTLSWTAPATDASITSTMVFYAPSGESETSSTSAYNTTCTITGLSASTEYSFTVKVYYYNSDGEDIVTTGTSITAKTTDFDSVSYGSKNEILELGSTFDEDNYRKSLYFSQWKSGDDKIAKVDENGIVTAVAVGTVYIYGYNEDYKVWYYRQFEITPVLVTGITLDAKSVIIKSNDTNKKFVATVTPDNATDKTVTWKSSDEAIGTVGSDGTITVKKDGIFTVTATAGEQVAKSLVIALPVDNTAKFYTVPDASTTVNSTYTTDSTSKIAYAFTSSGVDVMGYCDGSWTSTTASNAGWMYNLNGSNVALTNGTGTSGNISLQVIPKIAYNNGIPYVLMIHVLSNTGTTALTAQKIAAYADITLGDNNTAFTGSYSSGMQMIGDNVLDIKTNSGDWINPVSGLWYGNKALVNSYKYGVSANSSYIASQDSAAAYSWSEISLDAGESKVYCIQISLSDENSGSLEAVIY